MLQAYFPRPELPPSTVAAWATELEHHDFADGQEAIRRTARERSYPVLAETLEILEEVNRKRVMLEMPVVPRLTPGEILAEMPPEVRERVATMVEGWRTDDERDYVAEDHEWKRRKAAVLAGVRMHGVCNGAGKVSVLLDGKPVCPDCHAEVMPL